MFVIEYCAPSYYISRRNNGQGPSHLLCRKEGKKPEIMKMLFVPYGTDKAPATRYRVVQYLALLKKAGIDCRVFSSISRFSTEAMIRSADFGPLAKLAYYIYVFAERLFRGLYVISAAGKFDIIFMQRTTFPFNLEKIIRMINANIIFDIDDAIYMPDSQGRDLLTRIKRYVKESEVVNMLKASKTIIVENEYIKDFVSRYCRDVVKIPGPIDTDRFCPGGPGERKELVIGWIGSPATTPYLHLLDGIFADISSRYDHVKYRFIGLGSYENPKIKFERIQWRYETEVKELQSFDIGVMPMPDNEWTRGKLGCKMLQYMALGIPTVVTYTSTNAEIITNGEDGFFASGEDEWIRILVSLIEDRGLRKRVGSIGRKTIMDKCSVSKNFVAILSVFKRMV
jgi:glycosyltransferase involved in cell wall biosynthesis